MKKYFLYSFIGLIAYSFSHESVKLFCKLAKINSIAKIVDLSSIDLSSECDDIEENEDDSLLEYELLKCNFIEILTRNLCFLNKAFQEKLYSFNYLKSVDFPPELIF